MKLGTVLLRNLRGGYHTPSLRTRLQCVASVRSSTRYLSSTSKSTTSSRDHSTKARQEESSPTVNNYVNFPANHENPESNLVSILTEIEDSPGSLQNMLLYFWKHDISLTHIESRPCPKQSGKFRMYIDFYGALGSPSTERLLADLRLENSGCSELMLLDHRSVPWFPRHITDLDNIALNALTAEDALESDHPGFHDQVYRARRNELSDMSRGYRVLEPIPSCAYTQEEVKTWGAIYTKLSEGINKNACKEFKQNFKLMQKECGYSADHLPQAADVSAFLYKRSGFRLRPVAGLLSSRDFLSGLAFKVFFSTQYIRHGSKPLYTPEPDVCHELIGHAPMFADPDFAEFSQMIGLASLGASDDDIKKLAACYWHSVEFGLVKDQEGDDIKSPTVKAYGAGLLSSIGELAHACDPDSSSVRHPFKPQVAAMTEFPITTYQPNYFVAESLSDAKHLMRSFCEDLPRKFYVRYNENTSSIFVDRAVKVDEVKFQ